MRAALVLAATAAALVAADGYDPSLAMGALYYSKAAYCQASDIQSWSCGACSYHSSMTNVQVFDNHSLTIDSQAYVGYDNNLGAIVVAFRGSSNIQNWLHDLNFIKTGYYACGGCEVHEGFFNEWLSLYGGVMPYVQQLAQQYGSTVFVTGHSLGAAVSLLAALDIVTRLGINDVTVYNFGEPRVGNAAFAAFAASTLPAGKQYRVTHSLDPVPHVPIMDMGFLHTPHELWYDNDGSALYSNCNDSPYAEDPDCSDSVIPFGIDDHLLYLGVCTECQYSCSSADMAAARQRLAGLRPAVQRLLGNATKPTKGRK